MAVIDVFTYNGESDILEIHINALNEYVDEFIIVEAPYTFSGNEKPLYYPLHAHRVEQFKDKIKYFVIDDFEDTEIWELAHNSPNTIGAAHWKNEFYQKESIKKALTHLKDDDIVFIGDVDEVWDNIIANSLNGSPFKLKLEVYTYYLNNLSSEQFWGTLRTQYWHIKHSILNHLRQNAWKTNFYAGTHFTSLKDGLKRKLEDSYTEESYATPQVLEHLQENIKNNKDFLGRDFTYTIDESNWPQYLKDNRDKYKHLLK